MEKIFSYTYFLASNAVEDINSSLQLLKQILDPPSINILQIGNHISNEQLQAFRESFPFQQIQFFHTISPDQLHNLPPLQSQSPVYTSFIPQSPYTQVLPDNSLHLIICISSLDTLSIPIACPDHVSACYSQDSSTLESVNSQSIEDMKNFIQICYKELQVGGRLIISGSSLSQYSEYHLINEALLKLQQKGSISSAQKSNFSVGVHCRSCHQWSEILGNSNSYFDIVAYESNQVNYPQYQNYVESSDDGLLVKQIVSGCSVLVQECMRKEFKEDFETVFPAFQEQLAEVAQASLDLLISYYFIILEKI